MIFLSFFVLFCPILSYPFPHILNNLIHGPISFLFMFYLFLYRQYLSYFCPILSYFFGTFSRNFPIFPIFPDFSQIFRFFLMQSGVFYKYNRDHMCCIVVFLTHKKNIVFFWIFYFQDSFLKMEFGHL